MMYILSSACTNGVLFIKRDNSVNETVKYFIFVMLYYLKASLSVQSLSTSQTLWAEFLNFRCANYPQVPTGCIMVTDPNDACCQIPQCNIMPTPKPNVG